VGFRLQFIGGGKMGEALLGGLIAQGWAQPDELAVTETLAERLRHFVSDERLVIRGDDPDDLAAELPQAFDLGLLAFGVLGHVARREERLRLYGAEFRRSPGQFSMRASVNPGH